MTHLELFAGVGGFSKGFEAAGYRFENTFFSEIDKHAIANFKYNFPHATHIGSVTEITKADIPHPDILTFGSPCQDFSLLGRGAGLSGNQSCLIEYALEAIRHFRPDVFVWENVKGVLATRHRADFWAIIQAFARLGGYRLEWQLCNTAWYLPQNRERVYLVGRRADRCTGDVFPIGKENTQDRELQQEKLKACLGTITRSYSRRQNFASFMLELLEGTPFNGQLCPEHYAHMRIATELECERLQGFPDDFTRYGDYGGTIREIARSQRYSLLGNTVSVPVVEAVARRIKQNTIQTL